MIQPGLYEVYLGHFPFLDIDENKTRPVIIASKCYGKHNVLAAVPITTKNSDEPVDVKLIDWNKSGLLRPSTARVHRLITIEKIKLGALLGRLSTDDEKKIKIALRKFLELGA